jgi:hypothetical protein
VHFSRSSSCFLSVRPSAFVTSAVSFSLHLARSLLLLLREQRPDLRRLRRRNGFWKLDSRARESSRSSAQETSVSALTYVLVDSCSRLSCPMLKRERPIMSVFHLRCSWIRSLRAESSFVIE